MKAPSSLLSVGGTEEVRASWRVDNSASDVAAPLSSGESAGQQHKMAARRLLWAATCLLGACSGDQRLVQYEEDIAPVPARPQHVEGWPRDLPHLGEVSGVSVNPAGQPVIFHRGPRVWDASSFNSTNHFQHVSEGPIPVDTVLVLDPEHGSVRASWGRSLFYMPHGITISPRGDMWLTDVALHQVFKWEPGGVAPSMVFGQRLQPGSGLGHLCQPTAVAVASSGVVFIADGYCNSRVLEFSPQGVLLRVVPQPPEFLSLHVPHSLALVESLDLLCIADRENMRVVCPRAGLEGRSRREPPAVTVQEPDLGRVFAVATCGSYVYAVNGPTSPMIPVRGFTVDPLSESIVDHWQPTSTALRNPHALAVSPNGSALYVTEIMPNRVLKFALRRG
ncbi:peptidyl-alpha-hydroxyglycine alpha-amidating lyase 2-like [Bacillus rossius redtenbacheri]|uniref:peptidyl-alpha-hydroxyglycine alpha-amidating lyase 2-like n=1 Tax=Bacillus rossius redtenbacheri TaxID=93214 RepID=UPI002FDDC53A